MSDSSRFVTALFRSPDAAERAYRAAVALGYEDKDINLVVSDETAENGLFTISEALQSATIKSLAGAGITLEAADLFDLSLLAEVYEENPDLIAYAG